ALTLSFTLLCRRRRRCPCAVGGATRCDRQPPFQGAANPAVVAVALAGGSTLRARRGQPLASWPLVVAPCGCTVAASCGLAVDGRPLRARRWQPPMRAGRSRPCPRVATPSGLLSLRAIAPCRRALAATNRPYRGVGWPWPVAPLQGSLAVAGCPLQLATTNPDREDERGQASSSLAVSIRWISIAKLLQSDLATLAEGGRRIGGGG
ncbi:hypothetical protein BHE74_00032974, partial [Ensete ventricosum]